MTNEEAIDFLKQYQNPEIYTDKCLLAHEMAISALQKQTLNESVYDKCPDTTKMMLLTIEQLREMDGRPVWVRVSESWRESGVYEGWMLIRFHGKDDRVRAYTYDTRFGATFHAQQDYGISWWAYAYPTAHIDREAWEPCGEMCRNNCATCDHNADEVFGDADYCKDCHRYSKWESSIHKYCERCGRPRTPEAWAELEKRLRGTNP